MKTNQGYTKSLESRYESIHGHIEDNVAKLKDEYTGLKVQCDLRHANTENEIKKNSDDIVSKMNKEDGKKIWLQLKRFPFYEDLKDLNDKFLPELQKFQVQCSQFDIDIT